MFILTLTYKKSIEDVEKNLPAHIEYLETYYNSGNFVASGRQNPGTGGIILCNADDREQIESIIQNDPFYSLGIADYSVTEFIPSKHAAGFGKFVK